ncbi:MULTISPECIES: helix-turn-helix domain-containing protein [Streptomyces]|uniref:Helix-turn-helix domain-containing protein n=1 Tax=Streptomyces doudnae TaxID=3075536 RepID=A0ABD5EWB5_9ACTN|nr:MULTISPECIES: helix-turn-helix transcriptional regulator [unclassified Streptomyces]MDT0438528.1 helix-turn-helix domain-containing protein [Streptomyces sp. DSM 41981]MYQ63576.1 helix-turn-helix domain-containing protein [Streptomyces sp. SID4950]SCD60884.1 Helix-turn-helix [Streptomyces sp. SolWspMP-5a-2]
MASLNVGNLGDYLREQRRTAQLSLRQLADAAGVSNPYLSQIERGLRKPSAEVLQQVAKALRISAETLYVRAGILDAERDRDEVETRAVVLADPTLNDQQKQVLLQIYESFRKENGFGTEDGPATRRPDADAATTGPAAGRDARDGAPDPATGVEGPGADGPRPVREPRADGGHPGPGTARSGRTARTTKNTGISKNTGVSKDTGVSKNTGVGKDAGAAENSGTDDGNDADPQQPAG